jgi:sec-independent protein translocase protein TatA
MIRYNIRQSGEVNLKMLGTQDILLIGVIVVVLFGATRLPQLGSGIGQAIRNFKKGINEADAIDVTPKKDDSKKEDKSEED